MKTLAVILCFVLGASLSISAADAKKKKAAKKDEPHAPSVGYTDTPMLPGGKWHVHDPERPQPRVVVPANQVGQPPSDAVVLFDGKDLTNWRDAKGNPSGWLIGGQTAVKKWGSDLKGAELLAKRAVPAASKNGYMQVPPKGTAGGGDIFTRQEFGDQQLHIEFATPNPPEGDSQGRGNSGVFLLGLYEFQVLDSYNNRTYADGTAAALYGQVPPLTNPARPPGEWQTYDIVFTAPRFNAEGKMQTPAIVTAFRNGVLVQNHSTYLGPSGHRNLASYGKTKATIGPLKLQDHGNPMRFRNIWVRPLPPADSN